jgi:hypothetical protein
MKRATVVGGSLTALAAGILLRKIGWEVDIFERSPHSPHSPSDRGAESSCSGDVRTTPALRSQGRWRCRGHADLSQVSKCERVGCFV